MNIQALFFILSIFLAGPKPVKKDVLVKTDMFTIHYSEAYEQPTLVSYEVLCLETVYSRKGMDFFTCDTIHTSDNADYANNEYDKGHMAPAADFACDKVKLYGTFTYLNCALQHEKLNRGVWRMLEDHEREMAKKARTFVSIMVHFSKTSKKLASGATVPDGFTKVIRSGKITEKYYFPNIIPTKQKYTDYLTK